VTGKVDQALKAAEKESKVEKKMKQAAVKKNDPKVCATERGARALRLSEGRGGWLLTFSLSLGLSFRVLSPFRISHVSASASSFHSDTIPAAAF
jgi:hypothetical protein